MGKIIRNIWDMEKNSDIHRISITKGNQSENGTEAIAKTMPKNFPKLRGNTKLKFRMYYPKQEKCKENYI